MDTIRKALGAPKINFYGFSYGTYLAQVYATKYPDRVRRFVLDGVVNPTDVWYDANLEQEKQFDKNIDTFFDWIADNDAAYGLGTDGDAVRDIYYDVLDQLTDAPGARLRCGGLERRVRGRGLLRLRLGRRRARAGRRRGGDLGPAKDYYGDPTGPGSDNTFANYLAVQCTDAPWPSKWKTWEKDAWRIDSYAPFLAWNNTWYNAPCLDWAAPSGKPVNVTGKHAPPVLLISETEDAATPYAGALEVRKRFPRSVLIEGVGGTTHAGSLSGRGLHRRQDRRLPAHRCAAAAGARQPVRRAVRAGAAAGGDVTDRSGTQVGRRSGPARRAPRPDHGGPAQAVASPPRRARPPPGGRARRASWP